MAILTTLTVPTLKVPPDDGLDIIEEMLQLSLAVTVKATIALH